jgi:hypothetical protein
MTKSADLKEQLSKALPKGRGARSAGARTTSVERKGAVKLSISMFPPDLERLDKIKAFMATLGVRSVGDSQALRLALHRTPIDADMIYTAMRSEDGRGNGGRNQ